MAADQLTLLPTGSFINVSGESTWKSQIYPNDKFIPLQYTGLKDKNNKEIYEGDIIRFGSQMRPGEICFYDGSWMINLHSDDHDDNDFLFNYGRGDAMGEIEVLSNIYENPGLLENK